MSALNAPTVSRFTSRSSEGANISHIEPRNSKPISGYTISFFRCCNCFGVSGLAVFFSFSRRPCPPSFRSPSPGLRHPPPLRAALPLLFLGSVLPSCQKFMVVLHSDSSPRRLPSACLSGLSLAGRLLPFPFERCRGACPVVRPQVRSLPFPAEQPLTQLLHQSHTVRFQRVDNTVIG